MSIPRKHHYLPEFYLRRWALNGQVFRYVRPKGKDGPLDCRRKPPSAIGYERDLYHLPDIDEPVVSQQLESEFFQRIDDRAAVALQKLDRLERGSVADRVALSQFVISLLHRSPGRLTSMRSELSSRVDGAPYADLEGDEFERVLKATCNRLLASLVESNDAEALVSSFKAFRIDVSGSKKSLLTSDCPVTISAQLVANDAFMILPYAPNRLLILTHHEAIANAFSSQPPDVLVAGINQAVVEQSEDVIVAYDKKATRMIDRLFLRPASEKARDSIGLIRRRSPLVDLAPKVRTFSRNDKKAMIYLGRT